MAEDELPPRPPSPHAEFATRWNEWRGDRRIAAALLACVSVAAAFAWFHSRSASAPASPPSAAPAGPAPTLETATTTTIRAPEIVVDVVGAVRRGGIARLRAGARVVDAIAAAGGPLADADLVRLNLAAPLTDGARIAVPRIGAPAPSVDPTAVSGASGDGTDDAPSPSAPVNLNTATVEQLDALPGIGPATAAAIIQDREAHGPFRSVNDLGRVRGIGDAKLAQLHDLVAV
ncbi:MAG TPA: ComEA family DNA-binding protein [Acidimicrobiia bacterium]|nr:ComEA family DNA-binding protein [Acidimicrobiia bacterium]